jgi:hypothetical protein
MSDDAKRKNEPPLHLDMPFDEALVRYASTNPAEVQPPAGKKAKIYKVPKKAKKLAALPKAKPGARKGVR